MLEDSFLVFDLVYNRICGSLSVHTLPLIFYSYKFYNCTQFVLSKPLFRLSLRLFFFVSNVKFYVTDLIYRLIRFNFISSHLTFHLNSFNRSYFLSFLCLLHRFYIFSTINVLSMGFWDWTGDVLNTYIVVTYTWGI